MCIRDSPWVALKAAREALEPRPLVDPTARRDLFTAALDALLAREGPKALEPFDALAFVVAAVWWIPASILVFGALALLLVVQIVRSFH